MEGGEKRSRWVRRCAELKVHGGGLVRGKAGAGGAPPNVVRTYNRLRLCVF